MPPRGCRACTCPHAYTKVCFKEGMFLGCKDFSMPALRRVLGMSVPVKS
uniref:Uncharacterized protein n=1 Tax=Arundo donax TaxID=35708 RepID=A0A0A8ZTV9_ARUDO